MKIEKIVIVTVTCCNQCKKFSDEYEAVNYLLNHIRRYHKKLFKQLDTQGMKLARSQNGYGYYDVKGEGWKRAKRENINFVNAHLREALKRKLDIK